MREVDVARRLLLAFGANRFIVFGAMSETSRSLLCDAGSEVLEQGDMLDGAALYGVGHAAWTPNFIEKSCLVCLNLSDDALTAVLSDTRFSCTQGVYIQHLASETLDTVESVEQRAFALGYRKHSAYYRLFGYAELEQTSRELATLLEPVPAAAAARFPMARLREERDLHMDMLREAGRRSDAHVVRYDWASKFIRPNDVVLDAACGLGYGTYAMRHLSAASRFYGIDGSEWAVDYATACFASDNTEFIAGFLPDALSRFEDASVDVVVSFETLEHVDAPTALLDEFWRVLRPGGRIIVSVPNDWSDETGEDPNPHHLHVYTYDRLAQEVAAGFAIEQLARQVASGCKLLDAHCQWVERARVLEAVEPAVAPRTEAEWWLAVAMKSPETGRSLTYRETVHGRFEGATHLVDFGAHYTNPWLVHAMVEIPFRLQRADELRRLALRVQADYPRDSADHGAALAVLCYRALEEHSDRAHLAQLDAQIADYLALSSANPHIQRWQVSLTYVRARLRLRRGDRSGALADFAAVAEADIAHITPTLGTKVIDAAFWAGMLSWLGAEKAGARSWWRRGVTSAGQLIGSAWPEFFGNAESPFVFAMNDAVEIVDRATACAQALSLTHWRDDASEAMLYGIGQQSLRSALRQRDADLIAARAATATLRDEFDRVCKELDAQGAQKAGLEQASMERLARIHELEAQLARTQSVFADAEKTALARLGSIHALEARIQQTDGALEEAKAHSEQRLEENAALHARLRDTDAALNEVKAQSVQRLDEKMALEKRIEQTDIALEEVKQLSIERLKRIEALEHELRVDQAATEAACANAAESAAIAVAADPRTFTDRRSRFAAVTSPYLKLSPMSKKTCVFTSAALNYIPKVRLLFKSLRELHPEIELHLALSDVLPEDVDLSNEPFDEVHPLATLDIPDVQGWAFCHNIVELSTAIKPFMLQKLLTREGVGRVLYFDPDMVLFSRVDDLIEALGEANVILTPHQVEPEARLSAVIDNEICSLKHGVYNLGFVGVSATDEGMRFAEWWKQRIYHFCRADIPNGLFTDQRWIDLVPAFFSNVGIIRSPRHNVAPWNLTTREITGDFAQGFRVNGEPLGFYHFTGFDSGAHRIMAAINGQSGSQAGVLIDWYDKETEHLTSDPLTKKSWVYGSYSNGEKIQPLHRLIYRERVDLQRAYPDPFDVSNVSFYGWIQGQAKHEYPGVEGGAPGEALQKLKQQLTAGFTPNHPESPQWRRISRMAGDAISSPQHAGRYAKRAWEILKQEGLSGIKRRLV